MKAGATHSIETEQAVLGAILLNNSTMSYLTTLEPEQFFEPLHGQIFDICRKLIAEGKVASPLTLRQFLPKDFSVTGLSAGQYLARLASEAVTISGAPDYAKYIIAYAEKRAIIDIARDLAADDGDPSEAAKIAMESLDAVRFGAINREGRKTTATIDEVVTDVIDHMALAMQGVVAPGGIMTGLNSLDKMLGGLRSGDLILCAARPGMGKTSFAGSIARHVAFPRVDPGTGEETPGEGVFFFSLEMPQRYIGARMIGDQSLTRDHAIPYQQILSGNISDTQAEHVVLSARAMGGLAIEFDFATRQSVAMISAKCRRMVHVMKQKYKKKLGLVVVDYLKFVQATNRYAGQQVLEIGEITAGLKQLALDIEAPVMLLAQLNRDVEKREDRRPQLSDLKGSGDLEADADTVLFLYREAYYLQNKPGLECDLVAQERLTQCHNKLEVIVAKQRMGPTGTIEVYCNMGASAIRDQPL